LISFGTKADPDRIVLCVEQVIVRPDSDPLVEHQNQQKFFLQIGKQQCEGSFEL